MFAILRPRLGRGLKREESLKLMFQRKVGWHYSMPTFLINPACSSISNFYLKSILFQIRSHLQKSPLSHSLAH